MEPNPHWAVVDATNGTGINLAVRLQVDVKPVRPELCSTLVGSDSLYAAITSEIQPALAAEPSGRG
jgi:hypothetical protein